MAEVIQIKGITDFEQKVKNAPHPVLVDFYADWCGPCRMVAPVMEKLAKKFADKATIVKVDVDDPDNSEIQAEHRIMSIPTVVLYSAGEIVNAQTGAFPEATYAEMIEQSLKK